MAIIGLPKGSEKRSKVRKKSVKSLGILKWILSGNPENNSPDQMKASDQDLFSTLYKSTCLQLEFWERSGSVVECLTVDRRATGSSLNGVTVLCPLSKHINPSLVLVQPRKTCPDITEKLVTGR